MQYLLDTNICIYLMRQANAGLRARFNTVPVGEMGISSVTLSELNYGVEKSARREQNRQTLSRFLLPLVACPYGEGAAAQYGVIRAHCERLGVPIGPLDMMIAAHGLSLGATVVTNNAEEFSRVPGLRVEDWS